eukprot:NODE_179_length_15798_cov_0.379769.p6 type:complete len:333 gc:universal NODE_179_length_15798_cov_0.379769:10199-9201(-)
MSNFLSHDMTARDPIRTEEEELKKRVEINNSRQNVKRVQAPPMEMGPRDFNFDGSPKKDVAPELQPVGERRAVKASARITNGAYQYTPEQLEKMRVQNEAKREELRQFKMKHLEAKKRQEDLEREKDIQLVEENKKKLVIGDVQDAKIQNGRKKPKDHVNERSDNFDIILGQEVKHIFDGFDNGFHSSKQRKHPQKKEKVDQFEQGGQGEMITEDEFMSMGIRKNSISKENSGIDFSTTQSVLNSSRASRATSAQKSTESSRAPTASVHLPPVKSASPQASKSSTVATEDIAVRVPSSNREFGRSNSEDTAKIEHAQKVFFTYIDGKKQKRR